MGKQMTVVELIAQTGAVLGQCVWRIHDESRRKLLYFDFCIFLKYPKDKAATWSPTCSFWWRSLRFSTLIVLASFLIGCQSTFLKPLDLVSTTSVQGTETLPYHVVMANKHGYLTGPAGFADTADGCAFDGPLHELDYGEKVEEEDTNAYINKMVECMASFNSADNGRWAHRCDGASVAFPDANGRRKVLIFVHGGLNSQEATLIRARDLYDDILCAGYYPIFINWRSSLWSSYSDHLFLVRQGQLYRPENKDLLAGLAWSPGYLFSDVLRGIGRVFLSAGQLLMNELEGNPLLCEWFCREDPQAVAKFLREKEEFLGVSAVQMEKFSPRDTLGLLPWFGALPTRLMAAPVLDGFGAGAWNNMLRRTSVLFHTDKELKAKELVERREKNPRHGSVELFMERLVKEIGDRGREKWEFILVGHSMGAIIVNEIIRSYGEDLPISHIVYMAAACSIRDYQDTVWPYLRLRREKGMNASVHHLMLHPHAEAQDTVSLQVLPPAFNPFPRGSLLVWIDGFLMQPPTPLDLTLGRFTNLMRATLLTPQELRKHISFTVFQYGKETHPQHHGCFAERVRFWREQCWKPNVWEEEPEQCWRDEKESGCDA